MIINALFNILGSAVALCIYIYICYGIVSVVRWFLKILLQGTITCNNNDGK